MWHRWLPLSVIVLPGLLPAQAWNAPPTRALVARAIAQRATESDSTSLSYRARARGLVTFLVEIGAPGATTTRLLRADELEVEVYWQGRRRSKQVIRAWRDTTYFPTGTSYHRDHLGIVTDDFGDRIRIGEGDEIRELPHPLGPRASDRYDYRTRDTLRVRTSGRVLTLVVVDVRPRDPADALAIGTLYLDLDEASLVRSTFTFTAAAYRDDDLEDITIRLERALVDDRQWLPYRQEIEIRRRSAVLDFPIRSTIRARWRIGDYDLGYDVTPALLAGPAIGGLTRPGGPGIWGAPLPAVLDSTARAVGPSDLASLRTRILGLARGRSLDGLPPLRPSVSRVSEILRVNRVEGLRLGGGLRWRIRPGLESRLRLGFATVDDRLTGGAEISGGLGGGQFSVAMSRRVEDVSDLPVASGVVSSLAAQEAGLDLGDYALVGRIGISWTARRGTTELGVMVGREWSSNLDARATPARGSYRANPPLGSPPSWVLRGAIRRASPSERATAWAWTARVEAGAGEVDYGRIQMVAQLARAVGPGTVAAEAMAGLGTPSLPARRSFVMGGWGTLPGEPYRAYGGRQAAWGRLEWRVALPGPPIPVGWLGRTSGRVEIGPFLAVGVAGGRVGGPWTPSAGLRPVGGLAVELFDGVVRVEVGVPLRGDRAVGSSIDVSRAWWSVL